MRAKQSTIKCGVVFSGKGLQTGKKTEMLCLPSSPGTGISFRRTDIDLCPEMKLSDALFTADGTRRTEIELSGVKLQTMEHFMSALWALGVDNLKVEVKGPELPAMDGSALVFFSRLKETGIEEQPFPRRYIRVTEPICVEDGEKRITVFPSEKFSVSYTIDYPLECIKKETFRVDLDGETFEREIAKARTFCMKREAFLLVLSGMGRGATFENTLVLGNKGPMRTVFRFPNEPLRHKVLDLVGDLYMLGMPVLGEFNCERSGHALNSRVLRIIYNKYVRGGQ
jgi:UDP-3-O-acyl N-acetylglucosamine deacetylase